MKKIVIILLCVMMLGACQPTPESEVVVGKGEKQIENLIEKSQDEAPQKEDKERKLEYDAPDSLEYALKGKIEGVSTLVKVDAAIIIPENCLPIVSVRPIDISYDIIAGVLNVVRNGRLLYDRDTCAHVSFKNDTQRMIDHYERELSLADEDNRDSIAFYKEKLKDLYIEMGKAPANIDEANEMLASGELVSAFAVGNGTVNPEDATIEYRTEIMPFEITEDNYNNKHYSLTLGIGTRDVSTLNFNTQYDSDRIQRIEYRASSNVLTAIEDAEEDFEGFIFSVEEAMEIAQPIVNLWGGDLVLSETAEVLECNISDYDDRKPYGYNLIYTRSYNGVSSNYAVDFSLCDENEKNGKIAYAKEEPQEYLSVIVSEDGICSFEYTAPHEVVKEEAFSSKLMPFEEIKEIFDRHIVLTTKSYNIYILINRMKLGLMRIKKPNCNEHLIVPVWDFYGYSLAESEFESYSDEEYWDMMAHNANYSFLTINAIDGTIIDREQGY